MTLHVRHEAGKRERDAALEAHERHRTALRQAARRLLVRIALERGEASIDDVAERLDVPDGVDRRCLGGLAHGIAFLSELAWRPSRRPERHASRVVVYGIADRDAALLWLREHPGPVAGQQLGLPFPAEGRP